MDAGKFRGAEDIDKSKVSVIPHAIRSYIRHSGKKNKLYRELDGEILTLFKKSTHKKAATRSQKLNAILKHHQETFFFRYKKWQFRVF